MQPLLLASILFFAFANLCLAFPQLDLTVAALFATPEVGFTARGTLWEQLIYASIEEALIIVGLGLIAAWAWSRLRHRPSPRVTGRRLAFLLLLLALVPGLLVNQVFKEHWGRARPVQLEQFGGTKRFTPAFVRSDQGGGSFSSGHVAAAAWLVAVAVALFGARSVWTLAAFCYLLATALARVAAGGHFLSDAVISALLVWLGYLLLHRFFDPDVPPVARRERDGP
jgi:lipid A 4'-phosphatase